MKKQCSKCQVEKDVSEFGRHKGKPDGLNGYCRPCSLEATRKAVQKRLGATQQKPKTVKLETPDGTKQCVRCNDVKPYSEFGKMASQPDGLHYYCKLCSQEYQNKRNAINAQDPALVAKRNAYARSLRASKPVLDKITNEYVTREEWLKRKQGRFQQSVQEAQALKAKLLEARNAELQVKVEKARAAWLLTHKQVALGTLTARLAHTRFSDRGVAIQNKLTRCLLGSAYQNNSKLCSQMGCSFKFFLQQYSKLFVDGMDYKNTVPQRIVGTHGTLNDTEVEALSHYSNWTPVWAEDKWNEQPLPDDWQERKAKLMEIYWTRFPELKDAA